MLIDENFRLKLADFGWSRQQEKDRTTFCGTPDYLAPEMIKGTEQTEKLDIWTMGVLMYELLHGQPPFSINKKYNPRNKLREIQENILKGEIVFDKNISKEAKEVISAMLTPDPNSRPISYEILTFPFFTDKYPFLASLNIKGSFSNSKYFNKSKFLNLEKQSLNLEFLESKTKLDKQKEILDNRNKEIIQQENTLRDKEKNFYIKMMELDKLKNKYKIKETNQENKELQIEEKLEKIEERENSLNLKIKRFENQLSQFEHKEMNLKELQIKFQKANDSEWVPVFVVYEILNIHIINNSLIMVNFIFDKILMEQ